MEKSERNKIFEAAKIQFGEKNQMIAAAEEFSECSAALLRVANEKLAAYLGAVEELADAEIMCEQMRLYFNPILIDDMKDRKLRRLAGRLSITVPENTQ
jgi:hypothetical protein